MTALCASSGSSAFVGITSSAAIGVVSAVLYEGAYKLMNKLEIDDPMYYTQIHATGGLWGVLAIGIFHNTDGLLTNASLDLLFRQFVYGICAIAFGVFTSGCLWKTLKIFRLRIDHIYEVIGIEM